MRKYLLDTHTLIWFLEGNTILSQTARQAIESSRNNYVSIASLWEIAVKISIQKLDLQVPFSQVQHRLSQNGFQILPVTFSDTVIIANLPFHHKDPFDRMMIAQAITNDLTIITADRFFSSYQASILW